MNTTRLYPRLHIDHAQVGAVSQAGGVLLTETIRVSGIDQALSGALARWKKPFARHDPAKVCLDLAVTLALGGDALSDIDVVRSEPGVYGQVASDATVSRLVKTLAKDAERSLAAISDARRAARAMVWAAAGAHAPDAGVSPTGHLIIDLNATLITAHSEKEHAAPTFKRGYGFHPLLAFVDHGDGGSGEPVAGILRPGNAGSNTATDHITVTREALSQLPDDLSHSQVLVRTDGAGGTKEFVAWLTGEGVSYSLGWTLPFVTTELYQGIDEESWEPAFNSDGDPRQGADAAEITNLVDLTGWPEGMRVIMRRERPHPGAQLRFEDVDGYRLTAFITNTPYGRLAELELQHRRRARCEDRIRNLKDTGIRNFPLQGFAQNQIWLQIVFLAAELTAWMGLLALTQETARTWEPKRLRYRLYTIPAQLARSGRKVVLHLSSRHPAAGLALDAMMRLRHLPSPAS